jgi:hypothetical protein
MHVHTIKPIPGKSQTELHGLYAGRRHSCHVPKGPRA